MTGYIPMTGRLPMAMLQTVCARLVVGSGTAQTLVGLGDLWDADATHEWISSWQQWGYSVVSSNSSAVTLIEKRRERDFYLLVVVGASTEKGGQLAMDNRSVKGMRTVAGLASALACACLCIGGCRTPDSPTPPPSPVHEIVKHFDNGQVRLRYFAYTNAVGREVEHGVYTSYWENGQKQHEAHFICGMQEGEEVYWHENGRQATAGSYRQDKADGVRKDWYGNGQLADICRYKDGKQIGEFQAWHSNGCNEIYMHFQNGLRDGPATWWFDNGNKFFTAAYVADKQEGLKTVFYRSGGKRSETLYHNGKRAGRTVAWDRSGKIIADGVCSNGVPWQGTFIGWDTEDQWTKEVYANGVKLMQTGASNQSSATAPKVAETGR